jgi:hypothetical protein
LEISHKIRMSSETQNQPHQVEGIQNHKLAGSKIVSCPEVEEDLACAYHSGEDRTLSPLCPGCFSAPLGRIRRSRWSGKQRTPKRGLIRLGTWREILARDYENFQAGRGISSRGVSWTRPDLPLRRHFVVTRGIEEWSLYEKMAQNPLCLNIQVSLDVIVTAAGTQQIPDDDRLRQFLAVPKAMFRLKTLAQDATYHGETFQANVKQMLELQARLQIPWHRVLETPLRLGPNRAYQTPTPLEDSGLSSRSFLRCNSTCPSCPSARDGGGENRVLGCAATERILAMIEAKGNTLPLRINAQRPARIPWRSLTRKAWLELGGTGRLQDLYARVRALEPQAGNNPNFEAKVREVVQALGTRVGPATWKMRSDHD